MSGVGVSIAAMIKLIRKAYFLLRLRKVTLTSPIFARNTIKIGISKITPKAISRRREREKYSLTAGSEVRYSLLYPTRNLKAGGKTTKYPNAEPLRKQMVDNRVNGIRTFFSCLKRPGATKRHICAKITGDASRIPHTTASFR